MRKNKSPTLLQGAGLYIAKLTKTRLVKNAESKKKSLITITSRKQLHNNQQEK